MNIKIFKNAWQGLKNFFLEEFPFIAALPALILQIFFSIVPMIAMFFYSVLGNDSTNNFLGIFTLDFYREIWSYVYLKAILNSLLLSFGSIVGCLTFCFVASYAIVFYVKRRYQPLCLILMLLPLWTNFIVRIYSWFFLLDKRSILSLALIKIGIMEQSSQLLFNNWVTIIGMVYCYYPFVLLPLYLTMSSIKNELLEASADLGANSFYTLWYLIIPFCMPDLIFCAGLVGLMAFGEFAIPQLLGGARYSFWGSIIVGKFVAQRNFKTGAAYTFLGMFIVTVFFAAIFGLIRLFRYLLVRKKIFKSNDPIKREELEW